MIINGYTSSRTNVRSEPTSNTSSTSNVLRQLNVGQNFVGSAFEKDSLGRDWIRLSKIDGVPVSSMYIAKFISAVVVTNITEDVPTDENEDLGVPQKITLLEEFTLADGTKKVRTTIWESPTVVEE